MAESKRRGGRYCVAGGPNNQSCKNSSNTQNISFHKFPKDGRRSAWVRFVQKHRPGWQPSDSSVLCSVHFHAECFVQRPDISLDNSFRTKPWLSKTSIPSIDMVGTPKLSTTLITAREKRQVSFTNELKSRLYL